MNLLKSMIAITTIFLFCSGSVAFSSFDFVSIEMETQEFIVMGENECVPTSFLYMLQLGRGSLNDIYQSLPGDTGTEKISSVIEIGLNTRSSVDGRSVFRNQSGAGRYDFQQWLESLPSNSDSQISPFKTELLDRKHYEKEPGVFLRRIHQKFVQSIEHGVPPLIGLELSTTDHSEKDFFLELQHTVVVVGVQKDFHSLEYGFSIQYLDPEYGEVFTAYVHEELNQNFMAQIFSDSTDNEGVWGDNSRTVVNAIGQETVSPYLRLVAPTIAPNLALDWDQNRNLFIEAMVGFNAEAWPSLQ